MYIYPDLSISSLSMRTRRREAVDVSTEFILKFKFDQLKIKVKIWGISRTVHIGQICAMQVVRHGNIWAASRLSAQRGSHH